MDVEYVRQEVQRRSVKDVAESLNVGRSTLYAFMKKHHISADKVHRPPDEDIIKHYKTYNIQQCARYLNTSVHYITEVLNKHNINRTYTKIDNLNAEEVISYFQHHSLAKCAARFGCSVDQIKYFLRKHNVETTKHESKQKINIDKIELQHYFRMHSMKECAAYFGCSIGTIRSRLRQLGIHGKQRCTEKARNIISESNKDRWENNEEFKNKILTANDKRKITKNQFIERAHNKHGNQYNYDHINYVSYYHKVKIICKKHGAFWQSPHVHASGSGCPMCAGTRLQQEIFDFVKTMETNAILNDRTQIAPHELDIFIPRRSIAIEVNGLYWHSYNHLETTNERRYHLHKLERCIKNHIHLVQINEDEWNNKQDIVRSIIRNKLYQSQKVYARKCSIVVLNIKEQREFFCNNHLQGYKNANICYGLYYQGDLISAMSFNTHKQHDWEITRFANKINMSVVGGAGRLFKKFVAEESPKQILTYADRRYSDGNLYVNLGFHHVGTTQPNYMYIKGHKMFSRQQFQKHKLKSKLENFDPNLTEAENMFNNGYRRLWDAGHHKFLFNI